MRKTIGAAVLIAALACSAYAGDIPYGSHNTTSDTPTVIAGDLQYGATGTSPTQDETNDPGSLTAEGAATELALDLLRSVLAFF